MMKTLLLAILLLIGMMGTAQELYLDYYQIITVSSNDTVITSSFEYDDNWKLTKSVWSGPNDGDSTVYLYENDTLLSYGPLYLEYFNDSINMFIANNPPSLVLTLFLDENGDSYLRKDSDSDETIYEWDDNHNMSYMEISSGYNASYSYGSYLNPLYQSEKSFKITFQSSYSFIKDWVDHDGDVHIYEVSESTGNYPTRMNYSINGTDERIYIYHYHTVSNTPKIPSQNHKVLSVDYYDLMGREIKKPRQGFYIERKTTDRGIISSKHYIR